MRIAKAILEMFFWMLAATVLLCAVGVAVGLVIAPVLGYLSAIVLLGMLPLLVRMNRTIRQRRAVATIGYLEQAVRLNLPLGRMLYVAQRGERGALAVRLAHFRQLLDDGYPIGAALEAGVPEVGPRESAMIEAAERVGRLPQVLQKLIREQAADAADQGRVELAFYRTYPFVMAVVLTSVVSLILVFIIPKYETIFRDFGIKLPAVTVFVLDFARTFGPAMLAIVAAAVLAWTGLAMWQSFHPTRFSSIFGGGLRDRIAWSLPISHGIARDRGLADAFEFIADALRNGVTLDRSLSEAAALEINSVLRDRLDRWADAVQAGTVVSDAARLADMPKLVVGMIATVRGVDAASEAFRFLARYYHTRYSRAAALLNGAAVPLTVFFFAFLVLLVALAMFTPLITMINNLSSLTGVM